MTGLLTAKEKIVGVIISGIIPAVFALVGNMFFTRNENIYIPALITSLSYLILMLCQSLNIKKITSKTYKTDEVEIETLVTDLDACLTNKGLVKCGKVLNAKWYADALEDDTHTCSSETFKNFKELFDRINSSMCE